MSDLYLGVDPGVSGGIALISEGELVAVTEYLDSEEEMWEWINHLPLRDIRKTAIEKVTGYIPRSPDTKHKHGGQPGSAMFEFGKSYGILSMALVAAGVRPVRIRPVDWQKGVGIFLRDKSSGETRDKFKGRLNRYAKSLYPDYQKLITLKTCDAVLIAHYLKEKDR